VPETDRHVRDGEELGMPVARFPLDEVRSAIIAGRVRNMTLAVAVLATCAARDSGWEPLRPV
jgi:ADP-ribose pyrophosphatase